MRASHAVMALAVAIAACNVSDRADPRPVQEAPPRGELHVEQDLAEGDFLLPSGALGDRYEVEVERGDLIEIVLQSSVFDTYLEVVTPGGQELVNDDSPGTVGQSRLIVPIREAGNLKVTVTSYRPDARGSYRLDVTRRAEGADLSAAAFAPPVEPPTGFIPNALRVAEDVLASRGHHNFVLPSDPDNPVSVPPRPGLVPSVVPQPGVPGTPLPGVPMPGTPLPGVPMPGTPQPGVPAPPSQGDVSTHIQIGAQIQGTLGPGDGALATGELRDLYTFDGQAGVPVDIELQSAQFDAYLMLVSPSGQQWENDDANGTINSQILMSLPETGTYRIVATSYRSGESGSYLLKLRTGAGQGSLPPAGFPQPAGSTQSLSGSLAPGDERMSSGEYLDRHRLDFQVGQAIQIRLASNEFDPYLIVRSPGGRQWDNDDFQRGSLDAGLDLVAPESGQYTVGVTSYRPGGTGAYTLTITLATSGSGPVPGAPMPVPGTPMPTPVPGLPGPVPATPAPVPAPGMPVPAPGVPMPVPGNPAPAPVGAGQPIQGTLAQGDQQLGSGELMDPYPMALLAGQSVSIRIESSQFDTYLIVRAPSGRQWDNDDLQPGNLNSGLDLTLTESGTYQVIVTSYRPGEAGAYTLTVTQGAIAQPWVPPAPTPGLPGTPQPAPGAPAPGAPRVQPGGGQVFGIYVGITEYPSGRLPLCADDAVKLAEDMRRAGLQTEAQQILLTDSNATPERVRQAFADMARRVGPNDLFIFFYSGHGAQSSEMPGSQELDHREEAINLVGGDIGDDEMARLFDQVNARVAIIALDSCFSGGFARDVIARPNRMGFFSSEEDLTSNVASNFQAGGYLSHFLRLGLRGEADTNPRDALLTAGELAHYLYMMFGTHMQDVEATTTDQQRSNQHLVIDRGSVRVNTPLVSYR